MPAEIIETVVIGAGQAGLAMSEHLGANGVPHVVLERYRIAERWRSERWDSLVANGPAWHDRFPGLQFSDVDQSVGPNDFPAKDVVADYFVAYAKKISAPIRCGVEVQSVEKKTGRPGFRLETSAGAVSANSVVVATGPFQCPNVPEVVPCDTGLLQMHSAGYRNPGSAAERRCVGCGIGFFGHPDSRGAPGSGATRLPVGGPARPSAAGLSRARLLLVAGCSRQVGRGSPGSGKGARDDRRERRTRRPHDRFSPACGERNDPRRPHGGLSRMV